jgi:hypothetical protein
MVYINEIPWGEFEDKVDELKAQCQDPACVTLERALRRRLFTAKRLACDRVEDGIFWIYKRFRNVDYGIEVRESMLPQGDSPIQSHHYEPVIRDIPDIEKIRLPQVEHDAEATEREIEKHRQIFGDAMPVQAHGPRQQFFNGWDMVVRWTGVTEALMDLVERPDYIHALMRRLTDSFLMRMTQFEAGGFCDSPHPSERVGSGGAGYTDELPQADARPGRFRIMDQWGGATPQIFSEVSPEMHEEFALRYEIEIMSRCGLNYYGCCEPLHNKMGILAQVPRLRKISISPWCDTAKACAQATRTYVFSHKPNPAVFAPDRFDVAAAERELRARIRDSGDMPCELIMKDISTVRGDVQRVVDWCAMAFRVAQAG